MTSLNCGHTFCSGCLVGWFSTQISQHLTRYPGYNPNPPMPRAYREILEHPLLNPDQRNAVRRGLQVLHSSVVVHPAYTCPTCRTVIKTKPVESYALRNVVHSLAEAQGLGIPRDGKAKQGDVFEQFFPTRRSTTN